MRRTEKYDTELQTSEKLMGDNKKLRQELHALEDGSEENQDSEKGKKLQRINAEIWNGSIKQNWKRWRQ